MKCPNCGSEASDDALTCDLCQFVLCREPAGTPEPTPLAPEPVTIDSTQAVEALLAAALSAGAAGRLDESKRLAGRLFLEVDLESCAERLRHAGKLWIEAVSPKGAQLYLAIRLIDTAADLVAQEKFSEAVPWLGQAVAAGKDAPGKDPLLPLLLLGVQSAAEDHERAARYKALVDRGVKAMAAPGGKTESAACFEQALDLLPASPRTDRERNLRERLEAMLKVVRQ